MGGAGLVLVEGDSEGDLAAVGEDQDLVEVPLLGIVANTGAAPVAGAGNFKLPPNNVTGPVTGPHGTIADGTAIANLTLQNYVDL